MEITQAFTEIWRPSHGHAWAPCPAREPKVPRPWRAQGRSQLAGKLHVLGPCKEQPCCLPGLDWAWGSWHFHRRVSAASVLLWDPQVSEAMKQIYSLPFSPGFRVVLATCLCQFTHMWTRTPAFWAELYHIFVEIMSTHSMRLEVKSCLFFINQSLKQLVLQK